MPFIGKTPVRLKIIINDIIKQLFNFSYIWDIISIMTLAVIQIIKLPNLTQFKV